MPGKKAEPEKVKTQEKNKGGRPAAKIKQKEFEKLCEIQCTSEEICGVLGVTPKTLYKWCKEKYGESFSTVFRQKREGGKASLRRMQWNLAERNANMAIFLGKNMLGQRDQQSIGFSFDKKEEDDPITAALKEEFSNHDRIQRKAKEDS